MSVSTCILCDEEPGSAHCPGCVKQVIKEGQRDVLLRVAKDLREEASLYTPDVPKSPRAEETRTRLRRMAERYEQEANQLTGGTNDTGKDQEGV